MEFLRNTTIHARNTINPFFEFLNKFNILPFTFALIISLNLNQLSNSFTQIIISPIVNKLFKDSNIKLEERTITILGIKFQIGIFLVNIIQFIFILFSLYLLYIFYNYISNDKLNFSNTTLINRQIN